MYGRLTRLSGLLGVTTLVSVGCPAAPSSTVVIDNPGSIKSSKPPTASRAPGTSPSASATSFVLPSDAPRPSVSPSPAAVSPSPDAGQSPSTEPSPASTPRPTYSPGGPEVVDVAATADGKTRITGKIYDIDGNQMMDSNEFFATLTYKDKKTEVKLKDGAFNFDDVPTENGVALIEVTKYGYTARKRTFFLEGGNLHTVNFGEPGKFDHPYFLSNYPEIIDVEPLDGATELDNTPVKLKITLSEALTEQNRNNFIHSLRIVPLNEVAAQGATPPPDLNAGSGTPVNVNAFPYFISWPTPRPSSESGVELLDIPTWDQAIIVSCSKITNALTGRTKGGAYQIGLVNDPAFVVRDIDGNRMGTGGNGKLDTTVAAGEFLFNTVRSPKLGISGFDPKDRDTRWDSTHTNAATFTLKTDNEPPKPTSLTCTVVRNDEDLSKSYTEFEVTFDTDLVVFGIRPSVTPRRDTLTWDDSVEKLENFTFCVGQSQLALKSTFLNGTTNVLNVPSDRQGFGNNPAELGKEFRIVPTAQCPVTVGFKPLASSGIRVIRIWNNHKFFDNKADVVSVKVRAGEIVDPAGNRLTAELSNLSENQKIADITYPAPEPSAEPAAYRLQYKRNGGKRRKR